MTEEVLTYQHVLNLILEERENIKQMRESLKESDKQMRESQRETDKQIAARFLETDKQIDKVSKEIGHLNNKFGAFNEALVFPSLEKLFAEKFNCKLISKNQKVLMNGNSFEIDVLAISPTASYIIEIKSKYRKDDLKQLLNSIEKFKKVTLENKDKKIYGVIVATDFNKDNIKELTQKGIYFISVADDIIKLHEFPEFVPTAW